MKYALYFPESGQYSKLMTLKQARILKRNFLSAVIVDARTGIEEE